jgi:2-polyprenyl-3-methyl-5-hydroxy-6-metoxy-1,4-benzoquinol methylase
MVNDFAEFEEPRNCPVCQAAGPFLPVSKAVERCPACRVYFANPRPTQQSIAASYESGATFDSWMEDEASRKVMWDRRIKLMEGDFRGKTLLDVGTGDGRFLTAARAAGFTCLGTELSENGARRARAAGHRVLMGQFCDIDFDGEKFDVVTMWHVLEHVPNPGETLVRIRGLLKPGGRFYVAVPNEDNAFINYRLGFRRDREAAIMPPRWGHEIHLTYFQPSSLRRALRHAGFKVTRFGVDDIYNRRSLRNQAVLALQKNLSALFGWHFSMAMFAICAGE